jgi:hypothetical protein
MMAAQGLQDSDVGGESRFGFPVRGQLEFLKEDNGELLCGIDIERGPGLGVDRRFQRADLALQVLGHLRKILDVESDPRVFHTRQHRDQGKLHFLTEFQLVQLPQTRELQVPDAECEIGVFSGIVCQRSQRHLRNQLLRFAFSDKVLKRDHPVLAVLSCQRIKVMLTVRAKHVTCDHGVELHTLQEHTVSPKYEYIVLDVLARFRNLRIFEHRPETVEDLFQRQARSSFGGGVGRSLCRIEEIRLDAPVRCDPLHRDVPGLALFPGEGDPHERGTHRVRGRRLRIDYDIPCLPHLCAQGLHICE